nr:ABC transporter ATP-binding protein [Chitinophagales bacterium]
MQNNNIVIETHELTRRFGDFTAVDAITFKVSAGEIFGFLGANGAGKTTAMRILCGLLSPTSGKARVAGYDVYTESELIKKQIGYMSQKFSLYENLTVKENIQFFGGIYGIERRELKEKTAELIDRLGLHNE